MTPAHLGYRMPAEWEPHEATWIAWPHERRDWPGKFAAIPWVYGEIVRHLHQSERVCIEVNEARNGILVDCYELNREAGGEGEFRGGKGLHIAYRILTDSGRLTAQYTRTKVPPWGMKGGREGSRNYLRVCHADGRATTYSSVSQLHLDKDDVIHIITANGGGYGDPLQRPREKVLEDIKNEYITPDQARSIYGQDIPGNG